MTGPDRRVVASLERRGGMDRAAVRRATQLAEATVGVSVRKLVRMRLVAADHAGRLSLTTRGRQFARELRTVGDAASREQTRDARAGRS